MDFNKLQLRHSETLPIRMPALNRRSELAHREASDLRNIFKQNYTRDPMLTPNPKIEFFDTYKNISRIKQRIELNKTASTPTIDLLAKVNKRNLRPLPLGIVSAKGFETDINLRRHVLSEDYAQAFSSGLKRHYSVEKLTLQGSRLSASSSAIVLKNIHSPHLKHLDLGENRLGTQSISYLVDLIGGNATELKHISLEATALSLDNLLTLCEGLKKNSTVTYINLAKNGLKDSAGEALGAMLTENSTLKTLDLHWNLLSQRGASKFFEGLAENDTLLELDLSWNCLGTNSEEIMAALTGCIKSNTTLRHLDLSYNSLAPQQCTLLAQAFQHNQTILGVHVRGNACKVDSLGFLQVTNTVEMSMSAYAYRRILTNEKSVPGEFCWVCEKWCEAYIRVPKLTKTQGPMFLHTQLEHFKPMLMEEVDGHYVIRRAFPYRQIQVFFSDLQGTVDVLPIFPKIGLKGSVECEYSDGKSMTIHYEQVNLIQSEGPECDIEDVFEVLPRPQQTKLTVEEFSRATGIEEVTVHPRKSSWSFEQSIFKDYVLDTPELLDQCFEFDWKCSQIPSLVPDPASQIKVKKLLRKYYPSIKSTYKALSTYDFGEVFCVSMNVIYEFLGNNGVFDKYFQDSDFGVNWNAVRMNPHSHAYNPLHSLVRYQFLELFVRIAKDKYVRHKIESSIVKALKKLLGRVKHGLSFFNFNEWKLEFFTEKMERVILDNKNLLQKVFDKYCGRKKSVGKNFMNLEDFTTLCLDLNMTSENSTLREIGKAFSFAMMTTVDEVNSKRHMEMKILEFYEGLTRILHKYPILHTDQDAPLHKKISHAIPFIRSLIEGNHKLLRFPTMPVIPRRIRKLN